MDVTAIDAKRMETVTKALLKGTYALDGEEILAFAQAFHWAGDHYKRLAGAVASSSTPPKPPQIVNPADNPSKIVGNPVKSTTEPPKPKKGRTRGSKLKS